jgi:hypothetical protein
MSPVESVLKDALALSPEDQARLLRELIDRLGPRAPLGDEDLVAERLARRIAALDAGTEPVLDAKEALAKARAQLRRRS